MLAVRAIVLTGTITPAQAYAGFANSSVLLVVIAFIVAQAVVKSGLGRRISLLMVSRFGGSSLGLAYSIVLTDAAIAPAFPSNTARGGVLYPIVLSDRHGAPAPSPRTRRTPARRLPHVLHDGEPRGLIGSLDDGDLLQPDRRADRQKAGLDLTFGKWLLASAVPIARRDRAPAPASSRSSSRPGVGKTPEAPAAARKDLAGMGRMSRDEWITRRPSC